MSDSSAEPQERPEDTLAPARAPGEAASVESAHEPADRTEHPDDTGAYELGELIARGGFGAVYAARDPSLGREVALKVLLRQETDLHALRFREEARVTGQLEHPNIVPVHALGTRADGRPFFAMKRVRGRSLRELLEAHRDGHEQVTLRRYLEIFMKVLDALAFAHAHEVVHRDLKPANLMIGEFGEVLVMDWGLAKVRGQAAPELPVPDRARIASLRPEDADQTAWTQDGALCGTPHYMSPEQAAGQQGQVDQRADIYALGTILYELLTLRKAFPGSPFQVLLKVAKGDCPDPQTATAGRVVPPELAAVVRKAMALQAEERYASVQALQEDVAAYLDERAVSVLRDPFRRRLRKWARRNRPLAAGLLVALIAAALLLVEARLLPATLRVDAGTWPPGTRIVLNDEPWGRAEGEALETRVWPAREVVVAAERPGFERHERRVELLSGQRHALLAVPLVRQQGLLTLSSEQGAFRVEVLEPRPEGALAEYQGPFYERPLPAGDYRLRLSRPEHFTVELEVSLGWNAEETRDVDEELRSAVLRDLRFGAAVLFHEVADVDGDGELELILRTEETVEVQDLLSQEVRWQRRIRAPRGHEMPGCRAVLLGNLDEDPALELVYSNGEWVKTVDAATGEEEAGFDVFRAGLALIDGDRDGVAEIACATRHAGTQARSAEGELLWGASGNRDAYVTPIPLDAAGRPGVLFVRHRPPRLLVVDAADGRPVQRWDWPDQPRIGDVTLLERPDRAPALVVAFQDGRLLALDLEHGQRAWGPVRGSFRRLESGRLGRGDAPVVIAMDDGSIRCLDPTGRELWRDAAQPAGPGAFGDVDGDGVLEWLVPLATPDPNVVRLRAYEEDGSVAEADLQVAWESGLEPWSRWDMDRRPLVFDALGDGHPAVLVPGRNRMVLARLREDPQVVRRPPRAAWVDLDGGGRLAELAWSATEVSTRTWRVPAPIQHFNMASGRFSLPGATFGDLDGDGGAEVVLWTHEDLAILSGRDGKVLLRRSLQRSLVMPPVLAPADSGAPGQLLLFAPGHILVVALHAPAAESPEGGRVVARWAGSAIVARPAILPSDAGPLAIYATGNSEVVARPLAEGPPRWTARLEFPASPAGFAPVEAGILVADRLGRVSLLDRATGAVLRTERALRGAAWDWVPRRGPQGPEWILHARSGELARLDGRSGALLPTAFQAPPLARRDAWLATCADLDGDAQDEVIVSGVGNSLLVLGGSTLRQQYLARTGSWGLAELEGNLLAAGRPRVADLDRDGALDLLLPGDRFAVYADLPALLARAARGVPVGGPGGALELAYLARDRQNGRTAAGRARCARLERSYLEFPARRVAGPLLEREERLDAMGLLERELASLRSLVPPEPVPAALGQAAPVEVRSAFLALELPEEEGARLEARLRAAFQARPEILPALLRRAARRELLGDEGGELALLEAATWLHPESALAAPRYVDRVLQLVETLSTAYEQESPRELLRRALEVCEDARLHVRLARLIVREDPQGSLRHFARAIELGGPSEAWALAQRAWTQLDHGRADAAAADVERAFALDPDCGLALAAKGELAAHRERPKALGLYVRGVEAGIDEPLRRAFLLERRACLYFEGGQPEQGLADLREAFRLRGFHREALRTQIDVVTQIARQRPHHELGIAVLRGLANYEGRSVRSQLRSLADQFELQWADLARGQRAPASAEEFLVAGLVAALRDRLDDARTLIARAIAESPPEQHPVLHARAGHFYLDAKNALVPGRTHLAQALQLRPRGPAAQRDRLALARAWREVDATRAQSLTLEAIAQGATEADLMAWELHTFLADEAIARALGRD